MRRKPYMFWLFLISWTLVHLHFEYRFWWAEGADVFGKYAAAGGNSDALLIGKYVYYTKATWMFLFVWLQVLGLSLRSAVAWSFLVYSLELVLFFPVRLYSVLNLLLAVGCVVEDLLLRKKETAPHAP